MTAKAEKESKPEVNEVTNQEKAVTKKQPDNEHAYVLSQAAFQLYTSAAHSTSDVEDRLKLLESYLKKVNKASDES